jgi:hypothetical protein
MRLKAYCLRVYDKNQAGFMLALTANNLFGFRYVWQRNGCRLERFGPYDQRLGIMTFEADVIEAFTACWTDVATCVLLYLPRELAHLVLAYEQIPAK